MRTAVLSYACALLIGCGGDDGGSPVAVDDLGLEISTASCAKYFDCCTDAELMAQFMGIEHDGQPIETEEQCVSFSNAVFTTLAVDGYKLAIERGRIAYDADAAGGCIAAIEGLSCTQFGTGGIDGLASCRPFLIPKVADGEACAADYECIGGNCEGEERPLGGTPTDGVCAPALTQGQPCDDDCADGLYCGSPPTSGPRQCLPLKANGAMCNVGSECESDHCASSGGNRTCADEPVTCDGR